jgi:hypothetical protein
MKLNLTKDIEPQRVNARARINHAVEAFRTTYLTPGAAQAMVYGEKNAEIQRYRDAVARGETPAEDDYPYAMIDARLYGMSLDNGIAFLEFFGDQWRRLAPRTEELRRAGLVAIDNAKSERAIDEAIGLVLNGLASFPA